MVKTVEALIEWIRRDLQQEPYEFPGKSYSEKDYQNIASLMLILQQNHELDEDNAYAIALNVNAAAGKLRLSPEHVLGALETAKKRRDLWKIDREGNTDAAKNIANMTQLFDSKARKKGK